jgi:hypothetical protein
MATKTKKKKTGRKETKARTRSGSMSQSKRDSLRSESYAFPDQRKEPLNDANHVRNAIARFDQVEGVSDEERTQAWKRIKRAAKRFGVSVSVKSWRDLGKKGKKGKRSKGKSAKTRKAA